MPVDSVTYWAKVTWSKPTVRSIQFPYKHLFKQRQHIKRPVFTKDTKEPIMRKNISLMNISPMPYLHDKTRNITAKIHKAKYLRNKTSKGKTNESNYLRSNRTSKVKTIKVQYLRNNITSKALRNKPVSLKNNGTVDAKIIYLRSNGSIINKINKKNLEKFTIKPKAQTLTHISKKDQNFSKTEEISKAKITDKQINETMERQTTREITTEKPTNDIEKPPIKNKVASTSEVFTTKEQSTEEITLEKPTNSDITSEKQVDAETKTETAKTVTKNTGDSENIDKTKEIATNSEITTEKLTIGNKSTIEPKHNKTVYEENESMSTKKAAEIPASEDTTISNDNTDNNTKSVNTENQEVDLLTDKSKFRETTSRKPLPFRTTLVKRYTTKARITTTRIRLSVRNIL